jgi:hypothetical protein
MTQDRAMTSPDPGTPFADKMAYRTKTPQTEMVRAFVRQRARRTPNKAAT